MEISNHLKYKLMKNEKSLSGTISEIIKWVIGIALFLFVMGFVLKALSVIITILFAGMLIISALALILVIIGAFTKGR